MRTKQLTEAQVETLEIWGPHLTRTNLTSADLRHLVAIDPVVKRFQAIEFLTIILDHPDAAGFKGHPGALYGALELWAQENGVLFSSAERRYHRVLKKWREFGLVGVLQAWLLGMPEEAQKKYGFHRALVELAAQAEEPPR